MLFAAITNFRSEKILSKTHTRIERAGRERERERAYSRHKFNSPSYFSLSGFSLAYSSMDAGFVFGSKLYSLSLSLSLLIHRERERESKTLGSYLTVKHKQGRMGESASL